MRTMKSHKTPSVPVVLRTSSRDSGTGGSSSRSGSRSSGRKSCCGPATVDLQAPCDSSTRWFVAKTNGGPATLTLLHNVGDCPLSVYCIRGNNTAISGTEITLQPERKLVKYYAPPGTAYVVFQCLGGGRKCVLRVSLA